MHDRLIASFSDAVAFAGFVFVACCVAAFICGGVGAALIVCARALAP